jgi:hypothetical protein
MLRWLAWIIFVLMMITACGAPNPVVPDAPLISVDAPDASSESEAPPVAIKPLTLVGWQEPQTGAFLASVPAGWLVQGNLSSSFGLLHPWMELANPTGSAAILVGRQQMLIHLLPHPALDHAGYPTGTAVVLDNGTQLPVAPFQTGESAAETEARARLASVCAELVIVARRSTGTTVSGEVEASEGNVTFRCVVEGTQMVGEYHAVTRKLVNPEDGSGVWFSYNAGGYLAQIGYEEQAAGAFESVLASFTFNPKWQAEQRAVPGLPGLFFDRRQSSDASGQFFEDQMFDWCIRNGLSC